MWTEEKSLWNWRSRSHVISSRRTACSDVSAHVRIWFRGRTQSSTTLAARESERASQCTNLTISIPVCARMARMRMHGHSNDTNRTIRPSREDGGGDVTAQTHHCSHLTTVIELIDVFECTCSRIAVIKANRLVVDQSDSGFIASMVYSMLTVQECCTGCDHTTIVAIWVTLQGCCVMLMGYLFALVQFRMN